jgi:hypothetical protein
MFTVCDSHRIAHLALSSRAQRCDQLRQMSIPRCSRSKAVQNAFSIGVSLRQGLLKICNMRAVSYSSTSWSVWRDPIQSFCLRSS